MGASFRISRLSTREKIKKLESWYPSHNHRSVENGCISNMGFLSFRVIFHLNPWIHGRKGRIDLGKPEAAGGFQVSLSEYDIQQVNKLDGIEDRMWGRNSPKSSPCFFFKIVLLVHGKEKQTCSEEQNFLPFTYRDAEKQPE